MDAGKSALCEMQTKDFSGHNDLGAYPRVCGKGLFERWRYRRESEARQEREEKKAHELT
jgi:hypothetical protein